jgi:RNA polymerase sigma-70 factor (ECF subfamily)
MTDKELVDGCIREDRKCQRLLWDKYSRKIMALCLRYCQNQEEAEDAMMEAFVKIYDKLGDFRFQSSLETWMRRVAVNISINKIRARKNIWTDISDAEYEIGYQDFSFDQLNVNQLLKLIEQLPVGYRMVFNLYAIEGFSHKEIADTLQIDEGTSRSQLAKARKALQAMLNNLNLGKS